jgi:twitching motility protein PilT
MAKIDKLLRIVKSAQASDLHLVAGSVPIIRVHGRLDKTKHRRLSDEEIRQLVFEVLSDEQIRKFEQTGDLDFAHGIDGEARFRFNIYRTQTGTAAAIRLIGDNIGDLKSLGFSHTVSELAESKSGLVIVTGPTNSGKTTTLAAMVDHINTNFSKHIVTLEDPIEYIHHNKNSLISQRQIGMHAQSFASALRATLREDPDVILVGEMRDMETISLALSAAEVGLLVMGTLHTSNATATIDRIIDVFPSKQQSQIRIMLAGSLTGIISQQLLQRAKGTGRICAYELLLRTTSVSSLIREGKTYQIPTAIQTGNNVGMRLMDSHLRALVESGQVLPQEAMKYAENPNAFMEMYSQEEKELTGV